MAFVVVLRTDRPPGAGGGGNTWKCRMQASLISSLFPPFSLLTASKGNSLPFFDFLFRFSSLPTLHTLKTACGETEEKGHRTC